MDRNLPVRFTETILADAWVGAGNHCGELIRNSKVDKCLLSPTCGRNGMGWEEWGWDNHHIVISYAEG